MHVVLADRGGEPGADDVLPDLHGMLSPRDREIYFLTRHR